MITELVPLSTLISQIVLLLSFPISLSSKEKSEIHMLPDNLFYLDLSNKLSFMLPLYNPLLVAHIILLSLTTVDNISVPKL